MLGRASPLPCSFPGDLNLRRKSLRMTKRISQGPSRECLVGPLVSFATGLRVDFPQGAPKPQPHPCAVAAPDLVKVASGSAAEKPDDYSTSSSDPSVRNVYCCLILAAGHRPAEYQGTQSEPRLPFLFHRESLQSLHRPVQRSPSVDRDHWRLRAALRWKRLGNRSSLRHLSPFPALLFACVSSASPPFVANGDYEDHEP